MSLYAKTNLYPGINPHLNSALQQPNGGWQSFHKDFITYLRETLDTLLPTNYYAASETSLQVATYDEMDTRLGKPRTTIPDVSVYQISPLDSVHVLAEDTATLTLALPETLPELEELSSTLVYRVEAGELPGKPVTRIELLLPANKPSGSHYEAYREKRRETLLSRLNLVEIDFLHERRPMLEQIPAYCDRELNSYPYHIIISRPHPSIKDGSAKVFSRNVMGLLPNLALPLAQVDVVRVNFTQVYNRTFESSRLFRQLADYAQMPANFAIYAPDDQQAIQAHMVNIAAGTI